MKKADIHRMIKEEADKVLREVAITKTPMYKEIYGIIQQEAPSLRPREAQQLTYEIIDYI